MILLREIPGQKAVVDILVINIDNSFFSSSSVFTTTGLKSFPPQDSARGHVNCEMSPVASGERWRRRKVLLLPRKYRSFETTSTINFCKEKKEKMYK